MQGLGIPAWSFSKLVFIDAPLMDSIASSARPSREFTRESALSDGEEVQMAHALTFALWILGYNDEIWSCLSEWAGRGFLPDSAGLGLLWMDCEWRIDSGWAAALERVMQQGARAALAGHMARATLRHPTQVPADGPDLLRPAGSTRFRYSKLMALISQLEAELAGESDGELQGFAVLQVIDRFAEKSEKQWLKVAGDDKGYVLEACCRRRPLTLRDLALEFGCFVGYTTCRLGLLLGLSNSKTEACTARTCVVSLERDATHVNIARHILDLARLRQVAEVQVGLIPLVAPRHIEEFGAGSIGFSFMDHKGTRFHEDFDEFSSRGAPAPQASLLADNTLNPGSPDLLWRLTRGGLPFTLALWSLAEFAHTPPVEDWQCLSDSRGTPEGPVLSWDPNTSAQAGSRRWAGSSKTIFEREPWLRSGSSEAD